MLWRVSRYSGPGFPSPTTTWANASPPAYFSFSAFFGASGFFAAAATGAFLPSASAGAPSSLGLRSVRTSGSAGVTAAAASGVGATSSAIGGDTVATAWPGSLTIRTPSGGRRSRTVRTSPMARFETSASMRSGMLVGSVETSTSCMTRLAMPLPVPSRRLTVISGVFIAQAPWCSCLHEQGRDGFLVVDPSNGFAEQRRHRQHGHAAGRALLGRERDRVGDDDLLDGGSLEAVDGRARQHRVDAAGQDAPRALPLDGGDRLHQRAGGLDHAGDHPRA